MDILDDILKYSGLKSKVLGHRSFATETALQFPCSKSIGFHVVTQGQAYIHRGIKDKAPILLNRGDLVLMARGCDHIVCTEEKLTGKLIPISEFDGALKNNLHSKLTLVSGAYQFWNDPIHPFFSEIPDWFIVKSGEIQNFDNLQLMINLLSEEVLKPDLGTNRVIQSILDIMFSIIIRRIVLNNSLRLKTWSKGTLDTEIRYALELLHTDVAKVWSLEALAKKVGLSRAGLALKFKKITGDTPLHYLTMLRIQKSMDLLTSTNYNIENIAQQVGYQDAFGFSKAFKKLTGLPPKEFRIKNSNDQNLKWKF